jgi:transcriptional repressor NrdR
MRCPFCQHLEDRVVDSRSSREGRAVRRRRECLACARRFTTYEYIEERPLQVVKRSGEIEPYDRRKLLLSIEVAAAKRPVPTS